MKTPFILPLAFAAIIAPAFAQTGPYEQGVELKASNLLSAETLQGSSYRVRDQVPTDGYMAYFTIDSDFGTFEAMGVPQARKRIVEAEAIRKLVETSKGDLFAEGLKRSIGQPIDAVKNIVLNPVGSLKAAPKTVSHFFTKVGSAIGRAGGKMKDEAEGIEPAPTPAETGSRVGNAVKNAAGFDKAKLETAKQLGVDPYSDNARLREEMNKVTWVFFAGGLPLRVGAAVASAGLAVAATNMIGIPEDTYLLTESELALRDGRSLAAMSISDEDIKTFQLYGPLSTTRRHRIVIALETLPKTSGRGRVIQLANSLTTAEDADFLISGLAILAERQRSGAASYVSLHILGRLPGAITTTGDLEFPAPVDHVTWTEEVAGFANRDDLGTAPKVLVHTGDISPAAATGLQAAGCKTTAIAYPK